MRRFILMFALLEGPMMTKASLELKLKQRRWQWVIVLIKARKYVLYYSMVHEKELSCNNNDTERTEILKLLFDYGKSTTPLFGKFILQSRGEL